MSYGNGKSSTTHDFRALPLAVGALGEAKLKGVALLRERCLGALRSMGEAAHCAEPLLATATSEELTTRLLANQKAVVGLNKAYAERCRIAVTAAVLEQNRQYFRQLVGRLRHAASEIAEEDRKPDANGMVRQYYYVPPGMSISQMELTGLAALAEQSFVDVRALFRRVILVEDASGLSAAQVAVVREIHRQVIEKHGKAQFGAETTTVALPLQYTVLPSTDKDIARRIDAGIDAMLLSDEGNAKYKFFLDLSPAVPHTERIRIPLTVQKRVLRHLLRAGARHFAANSLTLELGPNGQIAVKLVVTQPKTQPVPLTEVQYVLSRDFGYKNTIALSLTKLDSAIDAAQLAQIQAFTKDQARAFLSSHTPAGELRVSARYLLSGGGFLDRINTHAANIDQLRSRIDLEYHALFAQKAELGRALGLVPDKDGKLPMIDKHSAPRGHAQYQAVRFFPEPRRSD